MTNYLMKEALKVGQRKIRQKLMGDATIVEILDTLLETLESLFPDMIGSVQLLDSTGKRLMHASARSLPLEYIEAINGVVIGPTAGSCGVSAYTGERTGVVDIATHPNWKDYREIALKHHLRACWSQPILSSQNQVLGTFALYYREPRSISIAEIELLEIAAELAGIAIEWKQTEQKLQDSESRYQLLYEWEKKTRQTVQLFQQPMALEEIFKTAVHRIGAVLNVDRCFAIQFEQGEALPIVYEYLRTPKIKSFIHTVPPWNTCPLLQQCQQQGMVIVEDTRQALQSNESWRTIFEAEQILGFIAFPIYYEAEVLGAFVLHTEQPRQWTPQEIFFLMTLSEQLKASLYQAKAKAQLEKAAQLKNQFISHMSHELRTPLNAVIGYSEMIQKGKVSSPEKLEKYTQNIATSGKHLLALINDLLDLSKIEAGQVHLASERIELNAILHDIDTITKPLATQNNITLSFDVHPELKIIKADPMRIKQILLNLISNAIKFNRVGGLVHVRFYPSEDRQYLIGEVTDTGIGIPENKMRYLFTEFYQVADSATRNHEGTGLGLALTKNLIELHHGEIDVISQEGVGSKFIFRLPLNTTVPSLPD